MVIRDLPFYDRATSAQVGHHCVPVKPEQIIVWVSLAEMGLQQLHADSPRIPAILDIGCNHNFMIHERHLVQWAGIHAPYLRPLGKARVSGREVVQLAANVWLHPNLRGHRDELSSKPPFRLELPRGIAVVPSVSGEPIYPRLPLLGLRAFRRAGAHIAIDCRRYRVTIRTPRRFWILG
jgi:hypothetical protein